MSNVCNVLRNIIIPFRSFPDLFSNYFFSVAVSLENLTNIRWGIFSIIQKSDTKPLSNGTFNCVLDTDKKGHLQVRPYLRSSFSGFQLLEIAQASQLLTTQIRTLYGYVTNTDQIWFWWIGCLRSPTLLCFISKYKSSFKNLKLFHPC